MIDELAYHHSEQPAMTISLNKVLDLYTFGNHLLQLYGMNSIHSAKMLFFHDIDHFNIVTMLVNLVRCIVQKRDQTVIDLQFKGYGMNSHGASGTMKAGKVLQKVGGQLGSETLANAFMQLDSVFLEENYLQAVLDVMITISSSKVFLFLP